ncbi:MAG: hypothetical protein AAFW74_12590 [Pseudomonadota bacterium]
MSLARARWLAKGQLTGDFNYNSFQTSPFVCVIYFEERQKVYVDSLGISIRQQDGIGVRCPDTISYRA